MSNAQKLNYNLTLTLNPTLTLLLNPNPFQVTRTQTLNPTLTLILNPNSFQVTLTQTLTGVEVAALRFVLRVQGPGLAPDHRQKLDLVFETPRHLLGV